MRKPKAVLISALALMLIMVSIGTTVAMAASNDSAAADSKPAVLDARDKKGFEHKSKGVHVDVVSVAASVLETTKDDVKAAIKTGKTGDLLIAAGKVDEFKIAYIAELETKLEAAVADGKMTQEEADAMYASEKEKIDAYDGTTHLCGGKDHSKMFDKDHKRSEKGSAA